MVEHEGPAARSRARGRAARRRDRAHRQGTEMNEPAVATWEERAVIAMGELLEANDKADIEAENQALATMGELIREHQEARQVPRDPAGVQPRDPAGVPGAQPAQPAGNDEQLRDAL